MPETKRVPADHERDLIVAAGVPGKCATVRQESDQGSIGLYTNSREDGVWDKASIEDPIQMRCVSILGMSTETASFGGLTKGNTADDLLNRMTPMRIPPVSTRPQLKLCHAPRRRRCPRKSSDHLYVHVYSPKWFDSVFHYMSKYRGCWRQPPNLTGTLS